MNKSKDELMPGRDQIPSLWDFALAFYAQPGVAETCLTLQDEHKANICLVIGLRWLDMQAQRLDDQGLNELAEHIRIWTGKIVEPLRALRRALKLPVENLAQDDVQEQLRTLVKQAELLAEKKLLVEIERWVYCHKKNAQGSDNLERYLVHLGGSGFLSELSFNY